MIVQDVIRKYLLCELQARQAKNPRYSVRGFAKHLQIDSSLLSKILRGEKTLGKKGLLAISKKLNLQNVLAEELNKKLKIPNEKNQLDIQSQELMKDWYYYVVLEFMLVQKRKPDILKMATQLGISADECKKAVSDLIKAGIFSENSNGGLSSDFSYFVNYHSTVTMRRTQENFLKQSLKAMDLWPAEKRVINGLTVGIDISQIPLFEAEIRKFQRRINRMAATQKRINGIYQLHITLFPHLLLE